MLCGRGRKECRSRGMNIWNDGCTEMVLSLVDMGEPFAKQLDMLCDEVLPRVRAFKNSPTV